MKGNLKCPSCETKLSLTKHYDATYEWFECPGCDGCFTYDEIMEGGGEAIVEEPVKKIVKKKVDPEPEEDKGPHSYYKGEVSTREVVNIMADEIQAIYEEMGNPAIDDFNAQEKALQFVRVLRSHTKVKITEAPVKLVLCEEHQ